MVTPRSKSWIVLFVLSSIVSSIRIRDGSSTEIIPAAQSNVNTQANFISISYGLDDQHVQPINASAYEWYYLDAVSSDGQYSIVFTFYTAPETGFPGGGPPNSILPVTVEVSILGNPLFFSKMASAKKTIINASGNGAGGQWIGTGLSFTGASDLSRYLVTVDSPDCDIKGTATFNAISPPHYPCGPVQAGINMAIIPHLGWSIAISDAVAEIDLVINGTHVKFTGVGYHDKNWGDVPFAEVISGSVWGHGRLGPYSIVWTVPVERATGQNHSAGYVAKNNQIISFGCNQVNFTYTSADKANYHAEINLGQQGVLEFDTNKVALIDGDGGSYGRWTGRLNGGIKGQQRYTGVGLYEHFQL